MKKIIIILTLLTLLLFGCGNHEESPVSCTCKEPDNASGTCRMEEIDMNEMIYTEGVWSDEDWRTIEFPFEKECITDKETAVKIACIFFENFKQQGYFSNYTPRSVFYDIENKVWFVAFDAGITYPGANFVIALRQENSEVIKMWVGE